MFVDSSPTNQQTIQPTNKLLMSYPFTHHHEVIFRDLDVMGHVNNSMFFTYMETARTKFLAQFMEMDEFIGALPVILGEATCRFISPAHYGEMLTIGTGVSRWGRKSFDMVCHITGEDERVVAIGKTILIMYDYGEGQSTIIDDVFKQAVVAFQKDWQLAS